MKTVLVVNEDNISRWILSGIIEDLGFIAIAALDGQQALDLLVEYQQIKIMITNFKMPIMNGIELILEIKERGLTLEKIILLTDLSKKEVENALSDDQRNIQIHVKTLNTNKISNLLNLTTCNEGNK